MSDKTVLIRSFEGMPDGDGGEAMEQSEALEAMQTSIELRNIHLVPPLAVADKPRPSNLPSATELSGELDALMPYGTESQITSVSELDRVMKLMEADQKKFSTRCVYVAHVVICPFASVSSDLPYLMSKVNKNAYRTVREYECCGLSEFDDVPSQVAREANMSRVQLAQYAVEDTKRGV
eukprot:scaffold264931_cov44-Prasinocladus_malaysianus.AAC.2